MAEVGIYWAIALIFGIVAIYLGMAKLKVNEIIAEINGSRRTLEELFSTKIKKIVQLKSVLEPYAEKDVRDLFSKLDRVIDKFIKSTTEEKIVISDDINSILSKILEKVKDKRDLILNEHYHTIIRDIESVNARLVYAKRAYLLNIEQYEKMKKKFPFSIFPWPHWDRIREGKDIMLKKKGTKKDKTIKEEDKGEEKEEQVMDDVGEDVKKLLEKKKKAKETKKEKAKKVKGNQKKKKK